MTLWDEESVLLAPRPESPQAYNKAGQASVSANHQAVKHNAPIVTLM